MLNRRKRREQYLLEVNVQTQARLRKRLRLGLAIVAALIVLVLTCYGLYRLTKVATAWMAFENPRFAITQIVVETDGALTPQRVVELAGVRVGQNLLGLDLRQVRVNLERIPLVRRVEVRRLMPNRLFIHMDERIAVARLRVPSRDLSGAEFFVDREGVVMKPLGLADGAVLPPQKSRELATLTGVKLADVRLGRKVESEQIYLALQLLDQLAQSPVATMLDAERIDLSKPKQLVLTTRQHAVIGFDVENFAQQLRRLGVILSWAQQRQKSVQTVDLTVNRGVPVTFVN